MFARPIIERFRSWNALCSRYWGALAEKKCERIQWRFAKYKREWKVTPIPYRVYALSKAHKNSWLPLADIFCISPWTPLHRIIFLATRWFDHMLSIHAYSNTVPQITQSRISSTCYPVNRSASTATSIFLPSLVFSFRCAPFGIALERTLRFPKKLQFIKRRSIRTYR